MNDCESQNVLQLGNRIATNVLNSYFGYTFYVETKYEPMNNAYTVEFCNSDALTKHFLSVSERFLDLGF